MTKSSSKLKKLTQWASIIALLIAYGFTSQAFASTIKIAILDSFTAEKYAEKYKDAYYAGITSAISTAKKQGINITTKSFTYGNNPLAILNVLPSVIAWKPTVIIGPHSSNQFLLLKSYFKHILVVSPYASDENVPLMPSNFYSLALPDSYVIKANLAFMERYYPGRNILNIYQVDCKDCIDVTNNFSSEYQQRYPKATITNAFYVGNNTDSINMKNLLANYKENSIIILQPLNYIDAHSLMPKIAAYLKNKKLIFLYNLDNWGTPDDSGKSISQNLKTVTAFRVSPEMINKQSKRFKTFLKAYYDNFQQYPEDAVSYMTYASVMSIVDAILSFPDKDPHHGNMQVRALRSYLHALKKNPNWYRPDCFVVYRQESNGEKKVGVIPITRSW